MGRGSGMGGGGEYVGLFLQTSLWQINHELEPRGVRQLNTKKKSTFLTAWPRNCIITSASQSERGVTSAHCV